MTDFALGEKRYRMDASPEMNPEVVFERGWARAAFEAAQERLRQEFAAHGKAVQFEAFRAYLTASEEPPSYTQTAAGLETTEAAVKVGVHRVRRRFGRLLRQQIAQTVAGDGVDGLAWERAVDEEMDYLLKLLGRS